MLSPSDPPDHEVHDASRWLRLDGSGRVTMVSRSWQASPAPWAEPPRPGATMSELLEQAGSRPGALLRWAFALQHGRACTSLQVGLAEPGQAAEAGAATLLDIEPEDEQQPPSGYVVVRRTLGTDPPADPTAAPRWLQRWYEGARRDATVGHFVRPLDGSPGYWDEGMYRLLGIEPRPHAPSFEEVIERIVPSSRRALLDARAANFGSESSFQVHYQVRRENGDLRWMQSNWVVLREGGRSSLAVGSVRDVTMAIDAQYESQLQREQLLLATDAARIGIIREKFSTNLCTANRTARDLYGLPDDGAPIPSAVLVDRIEPEDLPAVRVARAAARSGAPDGGGEIRYRLRQPGGAIAHVRARRRVIMDENGQPAEMVAVLIDDTAQVEAAARERALAERHEMALDLGGLGQWHWPGASPAHYEFDRRQCEIYGLDPDERQMTLRQWASAVHPADREAARQRWEQLGRGELHRGRASFRIVRPDGEIRWVQISYAARGRSGEPPTRVHGTTQDITEREHLLAALREERLALQRSQALAGVGSAWRHLESGAGAWSPQMFAINRRNPARATPSGAEALAYLLPATRAQQEAAVNESQRTGEPYQTEYPIQRDDGSQGWVRVWGVVESDDSGRRVMHRYCAQDITEQHALQRSTEAARDRLQALFDNALNAIFVLDDEGRLSELNPAACELLGGRREELLGRRVVEFGEAVGAVSLMQQWKPFLKSGRARGHVRLRVGPDGAERFADFVATAHVRPGAHLCMLMDVTARVMAERRLAQLAARQREDFEALQAEVSRDVHDQLGQVLSALAYETDALVARDPELRVMRTLVQRAVDTARDISRALRPPALDLGLSEVLNMLARESSLIGDVTVDVAVPEQLPDFEPATTHAVYRIVQEALSNMLRHAEAHHAQVTVRRVGDDGGTLEVTVEDDGRGIDPELLASSPGLGVLGMFERARTLGGHLELQRRPGSGTCVRLRLPALQRTPTE